MGNIIPLKYTCSCTQINCNQDWPKKKKKGNKNIVKKENDIQDKAKVDPLRDWDSLTKEEF